MISRVEKIETCLQQALSPSLLEIIDESDAHAGHAGARDSGGGHYIATIVSTEFSGRSPVQRHQLVYRALGDLMITDIHAFSMKVYSPDEYNKNCNYSVHP